ncbi:MAG: hypothetical protein FWC94_01260 [Bacteroidales bacterium]|nr:hypothetical protein [Bacteroidales bacterium]
MKKHIVSIFVLLFYANVFCYSQITENSIGSKEVFAIVEQPPEFPGGINAFREYMAQNVGILIRIPDPQLDIGRYTKEDCPCITRNAKMDTRKTTWKTCSCSVSISVWITTLTPAPHPVRDASLGRKDSHQSTPAFRRNATNR